jgi:hypothetical protein
LALVLFSSRLLVTLFMYATAPAPRSTLWPAAMPNCCTAWKLVMGVAVAAVAHATEAL